MIDLDNAHIDDDTQPTSDVKDIVTAPPAAVPALEGQEVARDRHTKKIFVMDRSYSMRSSIVAMSRIGLLVWPDEVFEWAEKRIANAHARLQSESDEFLSDLEDSDDAAESSKELESLHEIECDEPSEDERWEALTSADRDALRAAVLRYNLTIPFKSGEQFTVYKHELLRAVVARVIRERAYKFPDAKFHGIMFDQAVKHVQTRVEDDESGKVRYRPATAEEIITYVYEDSFNGGGTNITKGLGAAVALCRRSPSAVKLHHVILITDGCDYGALECVQFIEPMRKLGICLDVIHISDAPTDEVGDLLRRVCEQTGGEYQVADDVENFQTKFLNAAGRLLLTAGGEK